MATEIDAATITTIISNINNLYGNLISYTVGLILFVGAFVPAVISFFQRRQFAREYDELSKKMLTEIHEKMAENEKNLKEQIDLVQKEEVKKLDTSLKNMEEKLLIEIDVIKANAFHLQANQNADMPHLCIKSCAEALPLYIRGEDERNARSILHIASTQIAKLTKVALDNEPSIEDEINLLVKTLVDNNTNGRYSIDIDGFKRDLADSKKRTE